MPDFQYDLMKARLQTARENLETAEELLEQGKYRISISRCYYADFASVRAILALDNKDFSKHSAVIAYFQRQYIKSGIFPKKFSKYLDNAFRARSLADYDDLYEFEEAKVREEYAHALELHEAVVAYIEARLGRL